MRPFARVDAAGVVLSTGWIQDAATLPDGAVELQESTVDDLMAAWPNGKRPRLVDGGLSWEDKPARGIAGIKAKKLAVLDAECKRFIEFYPDGEKRYSPDKQSSFNAISVWCNMLLSNPETPEPLRLACIERIGKLTSVFDWINAVLSHYYAIVAALEACDTREELDAVEWDFEQFNEIDPVVWLEHVRF